MEREADPGVPGPGVPGEELWDRQPGAWSGERLVVLAQALAAALTPAQVATAALEPALRVLGGHGAALILRDGPGHLVVAGSAGYPDSVVEPWRRLPLTEATPAGRAVLTGRPYYVRSPEQALAEFPAMLAASDGDRSQRSWAAVPLGAGGEVIGAFAVGFGESREFPPAERRFLETVAAQCALALERARLYETAATERERLQAVLASLPVGVIIAEAPSGRLLLGNDEMERIWRHPFRHAEGIAGYAAYDGWHPGTDRALTPEEWPLARSLRSGEVVADEELDIRRGDGTRGTILVNAAPIREADGTITAAVVTFLDITGRTETRRRLALAYEAEQAARGRLDLVQTVTAGLSRATTSEQVGSVVVDGAMAVLGCDAAWIGTLDDAGRTLLALASSPPVDPDGPAARVPLAGAMPGADVIRTGEAVWIASAADAERRYPGLTAARGGHRGPMCLAPLRSRTGPIGLLALSFAEPRELDDEDRGMVTTLAEQGALALERALDGEWEHAVALTLQHSMLPTELPVVPGLAVAARYSPAVSALEVGGDWYDVLALPDGRVGVTVGDVVGRGLGAAVAMGQLRSALAALALSAGRPGDVLDGLERYAGRLDGARLATVVYGVLDPLTGEFAYACAGHPPPLLVGADGTAGYLLGGRSPLLCALPAGAPPRGHATVRLSPGSRLLLFTDGLVERRGESLDVGLDRLAVTATELAATELARAEPEPDGVPPGEWCDALLARLLANGKGDDDVALLGLTYAPRLHRVLPAEPRQLSGLRRELRGWLAGVGATADEVADVLVAAGEACANAVEHAYGGGPGELEIDARLGAGRVLTLTVADRGHWRTVPAPGDRGRGLPLMRALADSVAVAVGEGGTVVTLRRTLGAAA